MRSMLLKLAFYVKRLKSPISLENVLLWRALGHIARGLHTGGSGDTEGLLSTPTLFDIHSFTKY